MTRPGMTRTSVMRACLKKGSLQLRDSRFWSKSKAHRHRVGSKRMHSRRAVIDNHLSSSVYRRTKQLLTWMITSSAGKEFSTFELTVVG